MTDIRKALLDRCIRDVLARIQNLEESLRLVQQSANEETKSTAGDKYETARAMAQLEMEKLNDQLTESKKQHHILSSISLTRSSATVRPGSLVTTTEGTFFIATSLGRIEHAGAHYLVISPQSPIGSRLIGQSRRASISFNNKNYLITELL